MQGEWIEVEAREGGRFRAWLSRPARGSGPGLVLWSEIFGVNEGIRRMAELFAQEGYVVLAPDLFWRTEPGLELGEADLQRALALGAAFDDVLGVQDVGACADVLHARPDCRGGVGVLGHCLGGRIAVKSALAGEAACAVSYYGVGLEKVAGDVPGVPVPMVMHFGMEDPLVTPKALAEIREGFSRFPGVELYAYPAVGHAFANPARPGYNKQAADMAHTRTIASLRRVIGPHYDLSALWEAHRACEFEARDADATIATMIDEPYVNHIPTMTGGYGREYLRRFYREHFIPKSPKDTRAIPISRTVGADRVVNEVLFCFTHDCEIDWMLPGVAPTGRYVEVALVGIITFRGDKLAHEHIYWDQASVLVQIGLLDPTGLPVTGAEAARKVLHPELPSNTLIRDWKD